MALPPTAHSTTSHASLSAFDPTPHALPHHSRHSSADSDSNYQLMECDEQQSNAAALELAAPASARAAQPERLDSSLSMHQPRAGPLGSQVQSGDDTFFQTLKWLTASTDLDIPPPAADAPLPCPPPHMPLCEQQRQEQDAQPQSQLRGPDDSMQAQPHLDSRSDVPALDLVRTCHLHWHIYTARMPHVL